MRYLAIITLFLGILSLGQAQTIVPPGQVYGTWTKNDSPYHITGDIQIAHDSALIIEPGVKVEFQGSYEMKVMGRLLAEGTEADTILFTVSDTTGFYMEDTTLGGWKGIRIFDIDVSNDSTRLAYCRLEFGKAIGPHWTHNAGGALYIFDFNKVTVSHCLFVHNKVCTYDDIISSGGAVCFEYSDIHFTENTFINNSAYRGGAVYFHDSDPVFVDNLFTQNRCGWEGGAISAGGGSNPAFSGDIFYQNHSDEMGGAMMFYGASVIKLDGISITENSANWAGGMGFVGCEVEITHSNISHNLATWLGGGMASDASGITIRNSSFEHDSCSNFAGAIHMWQGILRLQGVSLEGNSAIAGGGVGADWSRLIIDQSRFAANVAEGGGGLHLFNCHLQMDSCSLEENSALIDAGALEYAVDTLVFDSLFVCSITRSQIIHNQAGRAAGGLSIQQTHTEHPMLDVRIDSCLIAHNRAHHVGGFRILRCISSVVVSNSIIQGNQVDAWTGGGTINNQSRGHVYNCLFYDNHAALVTTGSTTGGLGIAALAKVDVNHSTFYGNSSGRGGGLQVYRGGDAIVSNSIFWENQPEQLALSAVVDTLPCKLTLHYNDIQYGFDSINVTDTVSTVIFDDGNMDEDPLFENVGEADFHLTENSPVLGSARDSVEVEGVWYVSPPFDLEGNPRPDPPGSQPDMGAFENVNPWPVGIGEDQWSTLDNPGVRCYPNPFRNDISFEFSVPERGKVTLEIYNMLGQPVHQWRSGTLEPGIHRLHWNPDTEADHLFFYRLRIETYTDRDVIITGRIIRID